MGIKLDLYASMHADLNFLLSKLLLKPPSLADLPVGCAIVLL